MRKLVALVVIGLITSFNLFGHRLVVNRTHSLPVGLYYLSDVPIKKGSIEARHTRLSVAIQEELRCVIAIPEKTLLDVYCRSFVL
jgi:type IV secretory pathway protease TraF